MGDNGEVEVDLELAVLPVDPKLGTNSRITDVRGLRFDKVICPLPGVYVHDADRTWDDLCRYEDKFLLLSAILF